VGDASWVTVVDVCRRSLVRARVWAVLNYSVTRGWGGEVVLSALIQAHSP
jgi:hypothetical protein